jgi:hypothetical protein
MFYDAEFSQFEIGLQVVGFVPGGRETNSTEITHLVQKDVYHGFSSLERPSFAVCTPSCWLHPVKYIFGIVSTFLIKKNTYP